MHKKTFRIFGYGFALFMIAVFDLLTPSNTYVLAQGSYPPPVTTESSQSYTSHRVFLPIMSKKKAPTPSKSYYIWNTSNMYGSGCDAGVRFLNINGIQDVFVFLDFGVPNQDQTGALGTVMYGQETITISGISSAAFIYALGFYYCNSIDTIKVAIGTNTSGGNYTDIISYAHGQAWANLVIDVNNRIHDQTISYSGWEHFEANVKAVGGNNIEPGFNPPYVAEHWLEGYNSITNSNRQFVYIVGSADGCPMAETNVHICDYGWTQENVYKVNWEYTLSYPFPEIYNTVGANADQWYQIALYAYSHHNGVMMDFKGEITQYQACLDAPNDPNCPGANNDPATGFFQLSDKISNDHRVSNSMIWSTDISYYNRPTP